MRTDTFLRLCAFLVSYAVCSEQMMKDECTSDSDCQIDHSCFHHHGLYACYAALEIGDDCLFDEPCTQSDEHSSCEYSEIFTVNFFMTANRKCTCVLPTYFDETGSFVCITKSSSIEFFF